MSLASLCRRTDLAGVAVSIVYSRILRSILKYCANELGILVL